MADFSIRLMNGVKDVATLAPWYLASGALVGFIYAKLSDLPPLQVAKAMAIWRATELVFPIIGVTFSESKVIRNFIRLIVLTTSTIVGLQEMQRRGLIGPKMAILLALRALVIGSVIIILQKRFPAPQS